MSEQDAEIQHLKASLSCAVLLERLPPVWRLDRAESTRRSLKYRRGEGEIVIVNHDGRGWWDPLSEAKGDIFTLVQHLEPGLNFTEARRMLRGFVGIAPTFPEALRTRRARAPRLPVTQRWDQAPAAVARITGLALSHRAAGIAGPYPRGAARGRRRPRRPTRQRLVRAPGRGGTPDRDRDARPRLAQFLGGRRQDAVPPAGWPWPSEPRRGVRGGDRRPEPGGDRTLSARHAVCRHRRRHGSGDRSSRCNSFCRSWRPTGPAC